MVNFTKQYGCRIEPDSELRWSFSLIVDNVNQRTVHYCRFRIMYINYKTLDSRILLPIHLVRGDWCWAKSNSLTLTLVSWLIISLSHYLIISLSSIFCSTKNLVLRNFVSSNPQSAARVTSVSILSTWMLITPLSWLVIVWDWFSTVLSLNLSSYRTICQCSISF
jgi:hypothetical protein